MSRLSIDISEGLHRTITSEASPQGLNLRDYVLQRLNVSEAGLNDRQINSRFTDSGLAGLWVDRDDMANPDAWLRAQRKGRDFDQSASDAD